MQLEGDSLKRLEQKRRAHLDQAIRALLEEDDADKAARHLLWVETAARVLRATSKSTPSAYVAGFIFLACLTLIGLAWSIHKSANPVQLEARVDGLQFQLKESWNAIRNVSVTGISGTGISELGTSSIGDLRERDFRLSRFEGQIQSLTLSAGAQAEMEFQSGGFSLFVERGNVRAEIGLVRGKLLTGSGDGQARVLRTGKDAPPEYFHFSGERTGREAAPVRIDIETDEVLQFSSFGLSGIGFRREEPPHSGFWQSTLLNAKGALTDLNRPVALKRRQWLEMDGVDVAVISERPRGHSARGGGG